MHISAYTDTHPLDLKNTLASSLIKNFSKHMERRRLLSCQKYRCLQGLSDLHAVSRTYIEIPQRHIQGVHYSATDRLFSFRIKGLVIVRIHKISTHVHISLLQFQLRPHHRLRKPKYNTPPLSGTHFCSKKPCTHRNSVSLLFKDSRISPNNRVLFASLSKIRYL